MVSFGRTGNVAGGTAAIAKMATINFRFMKDLLPSAMMMYLREGWMLPKFFF
jgi:hypothetical protein